MEKLIIYLFILIGIIISWKAYKRRASKDYREHIEPVLDLHNLNYITSKYPGLFKVGPFPKFSVEVGGTQTKICGIRGEYNQYRIVKCSDPKGALYELWVCLEFKAFQFHSIHWRIENGKPVPPEIEYLLEK